MNMHTPLRAAIAERVEIVTTSERLAEIGPAWTALWRENDGLIFQSHAWVAAWWRTVPDQAQRALRIGLVWQAERLVAVLPLAVSRRRGLRLLEWAAASYVDYGDLLLSADCSPDALARLWRGIRRSGGFDTAMLGRLLPEARAAALIEASAAFRPNHRQEQSFRVGGPFTTGDAWLDAQSKKTRQNYRRGVKALEETGEVRFRLVGPDEDVAPILAQLNALKSRWLEKQGLSSDLFGSDTATLTALVEVLREAGILRVFLIECAGRLVAVSVNFVQRGSMMAFLTTYDPDFERASPGMLLMVDYVRWSIDNGLALVDFLCGAEPFKLRFANVAVTLRTVTASRTALGVLAGFADAARHRFREKQKARAAASETPAEG